ncbi:MAG: 1-acyl-sn-glycerol-3-phosphate acyltransferase [Flavobacteriales bacterium]|nr:1-acyl-sn-glycerol-3-phosphate acyltransferase [Flavobacteriales bacterium]
MNKILWLPRLLYKIYFLVMWIFSFLVLYPLFYWSTAKESRFIHTLHQIKFWAKFQLVVCGIRVKTIGVGNIPLDRPFILCANHTSYLDIIIMYRIMPKLFVMMGKGEIKDWPLINRFFTTGMNILVHRENNKLAHRALEEAKSRLDKGHNIVIFPEGGIPDHNTPKMKGFKNGAFKMAIEKQVPILPMTFQTNWKVLQAADGLNGRAAPGLSRVIFHEPIETKGLTMEDMIDLRAKTRDIIAGPLEQYYS